MQLFRLTVIATVLAAVLPGCTDKKPHPPLSTAEFVDLARYSGRWYEIARYPHSFEKGCSEVTADYTLREDGTLRVVNRCLLREQGGRVKTAVGRAKVADPATNAKLRVSFFRPFYGDYWIIYLDPDYRHAIVGAPSREYLWILSRTPRMDPELLQELLARIRRQGFDPDKLILTPQGPDQG